MIRIRRSLEAGTNAERIAAVIGDPTDASVWLPGISGAEVLAREGDVSVVELRGPRLDGGRLVLECVQASAQRFVFAEADRYRGSGISGSVAVEDSAAGDGALVDVSVDHEGPFFHLIKRWTLNRILDQTLAALVRYAAGSGPAGSTSGRRKILEIVRRDGTVFVCIEGRSFELPIDVAVDAS